MAAVYASITSIFGVLACLRYEQAIVLPDSQEEAASIFSLSVFAAIGVSLFTIPLIWITGPYLLDGDKYSILGRLIWLVPVSVFVYGLTLALEYWSTRNKRFTQLSIARLFSSVTSNSGMLGSGTLGYTSGSSMIFSNLAGQSVSCSLLAKSTWKIHGMLIWKNLSFQKVRDSAYRYKKFPLYNGWAGLLNIVSWQLPIFVLTGYFSPEIAGFYAFGFRIIQMPMSLIGGAVTQVFHQSASEANNNGRLPQLVETLVQKMIKISVFPTIILLLTGKDLYIFSFGENWAEAGVYTQILSIWGLVWFISGPLNTLFGVLELQEKGLKAACCPRFTLSSSIAGK